MAETLNPVERDGLVENIYELLRCASHSSGGGSSRFSALRVPDTVIILGAGASQQRGSLFVGEAHARVVDLHAARGAEEGVVEDRRPRREEDVGLPSDEPVEQFIGPDARGVVLVLEGVPDLGKAPARDDRHARGDGL